MLLSAIGFFGDDTQPLSPVITQKQPAFTGNQAASVEKGRLEAAVHGFQINCVAGSTSVAKSHACGGNEWLAQRPEMDHNRSVNRMISSA